jgi:hypothetical protein
MAMMSDTPTSRDNNKAKRAQLNEAAMSIRITDFVAPKSPNLTAESIKVVF